MEEQTAGLLQLIRAAGRLHRISLQLRLQPGDVVSVTGYQYAENVSVVFVSGGYDIWTAGSDGLDLTETDLPLEVAAMVVADAYMEAKARHVITQTWRMEPLVAERVLSDPEEREWFFGQMDVSSDAARQKIAKRHTN
jgi:hypothetical protein